GGFAPGGRWAQHFTIIAWPITHAILPQYLQPHFAAHLYALRHDIAQREDRSLTELGELIRDRYHGTSSRFREFLQQTELTARLVLALRDEDVADVVAPVRRETLGRIVRDLEQGRSARRHLREARQVLRDARLRASRGLVNPRSSSQALQRERGARA